jgi:hypothetical protein
MKLSFASAISVLAWVGLVAGRRPGILTPPLDKGDEFAIETAGASSTTGSAFFTQILDHDNPSKGTFQQKFWYNSQYWKGPGSPVCLVMCSMESNSNCSSRLFSSRRVKLQQPGTEPICQM